MSKAIPPISKYMTTSPHTIGVEQTLDVATKMMHDYKVRHLPVLHGGQVVGILSARDIALVETLSGVDPKVVVVEEAMTQQPYVVDASTLVTEVASEMASHKYGAVVVMQNHKIVGVFTTVDACRVLAELFEGRLKAS